MCLCVCVCMRVWPGSTKTAPRTCELHRVSLVTENRAATWRSAAASPLGHSACSVCAPVCRTVSRVMVAPGGITAAALMTLMSSPPSAAQTVAPFAASAHAVRALLHVAATCALALEPRAAQHASQKTPCCSSSGRSSKAVAWSVPPAGSHPSVSVALSTPPLHAMPLTAAAIMPGMLTGAQHTTALTALRVFQRVWVCQACPKKGHALQWCRRRQCQHACSGTHACMHACTIKTKA
jgi:hypothetical protein